MTEEIKPKKGGPIPKTRADDARGAPAGAGVITPEHGGRIGNPPYVPTEENRVKVRELSQVFPIHARHYIARLIGVSVSTLDRHYGDDMELGRATMLSQIGHQLLARAVQADADIAKGDLDAQKFIMARLGGWSTKLEVTGKDGGPVQVKQYDLSHLSEDEKRILLSAVGGLLGEDGDKAEDDAPAA